MLIKKHYGYVYEIINSLNDTTYVGQHQIPTSRNEKWRAYMDSGADIRNAITKYGADNFDKRLLSYADNADESDSLESFYIQSRHAKY